jgi:ABC-type transport system involved in cytochrome c biogenesis permease component
MSFLPVVARELRVAARRKGTWRTRFLAVLSALVVFLWIFGTMSRFARPEQISEALFHGMVWLAFAYALVIGAFTTADCLSEEKREGTLGLLFLTDLKGLDIVLGKLAATSLNAVYGLLAIFPIMAIPLLMGGVRGEDMAKAALALVNTLFLSLAVGMLVSAHGRDERRVAGATIGLMALVTAGMPLLGLIVGEGVGDRWFANEADAELAMSLLMLPSPGCALVTALYGQQGFPILDAYWWSVAINHLLAWLCLALACRHLRDAWKDKAASARAIRLTERWKQWCYGDGAERVRYRQRLMTVNPFYWLGARDRLKPWFVWLFLGVVAASYLWAWLESGGREMFDLSVGIMFCYPAHIALKLWMVGEACGRLGRDRQSGALELILATPARVDDLLRGHWLALHRQFLAPTAFLVCVECLYFFQENDSESRWIVGVYIATSLLDYWALGWVGLWCGLTARKLSNATRATTARVLVLPWLLWLGWVLLAIMGRTRGSFEMAMFFWGLFSAGAAVSFGMNARTSLHERFREVAVAKPPAQ